MLTTILFVTFGASLVATGACGNDNRGFLTTVGTFDSDAGTDAGACPLQCSLDGRFVVRSCTGEKIEDCPPEQACGDAKCQEPCAAAAVARSSNGCDFLFQIPRFNKYSLQHCFATFLVNTSAVPVDVALEFDGKPIDISKALYRTNPGDSSLIQHDGLIQPGDSAILFVSDRDPNIRRPIEYPPHVACPRGVTPAVLAESTLPVGVGIGKAFRLTSNVPIGATSMYPFGGAGSFIPMATLLLPVATWGTESMIVNGWEATQVGVPAAHIFAAEDGTTVTVTPTVDLQGGNGLPGTPAQVPATYRLERNQILQLAQSVELSGTIVSSNKPTSIVGAQSCAFVPSRGGACDVLAQQLPAYEQWGSEYVGVGYRPRTGNEHEPMPYRIVAAKDHTRFDWDPELPMGAPLELAAGQVVTFWSGTGDAFVVRSQDADHPFYLAALMTGPDSDGSSMAPNYGGRGDPEFVNVVPSGQYLSSYSFYADPTYAETSLVVVRSKNRDKFEDVWLECAGTLTDFRPIGTRGQYEFVRIDLSRNHEAGQAFGSSVCRTGLQRMRSDGPFTATLWGWDLYASYAYPGGMAQRKLVNTPLAPVH
ncbi:hypothetical protein AKJ09_00901 [Labilithrix luteola]|uniref:IgGFc-binding protein N-terminal domain-containing protein n=1 Tax=Labilithrix luteola TaxID=1391654 RepID=A0A0K1PL50_9BACT|nr:hypothetical protein AKJ09_00901 [Labilithrix luteola]